MVNSFGFGWDNMGFSTPDAKFTSALARRGLIAEYGAAGILPRLLEPAPSACCDGY
ncbi:hypothetical protein ACLQ2N_07685 [Streptomyces sp. DT224]|uniref:hypothetical protein n=1 Tax=Streptomyces sp. DT224 TaxID=3393426 RepID=UPI003CEFD4D2